MYFDFEYISKKSNIDISVLQSNLVKENLIDKSFIDDNMADFFDDELYYIKENSSYIYFFNNSKNRKNSILLVEFFKALINLKKEYNNIIFFIIDNNSYLELKSLITNIPYSMDKYSPDFDYILKDFEESTDESLKKEIKLKMFLQMLKFVFNDDELTNLCLSFLNANK